VLSVIPAAKRGGKKVPPKGPAESDQLAKIETDVADCDISAASIAEGSLEDSQSESCSRSQRSGCSKAISMLSTAATSIASPSAARVMQPEITSEALGKGADAAEDADGPDRKVGKTAAAGRRVAGKRTKRDESQSENVDVPDAEIKGATAEDDGDVLVGGRVKKRSKIAEKASLPDYMNATSIADSAVPSDPADQGLPKGESAAVGKGKKAGGKKISRGESQADTGSTMLDVDDQLNSEKKEENEVRILNTGLLYGDEEFEELAKEFGAAVAAGPHNATHIVTTDTIKRTPKVLRTSIPYLYPCYMIHYGPYPCSVQCTA
jgi:trimeric autotransporter adhesin